MSKNYLYKGKDYKGKDYKAFKLSYLSNHELSEDDLYWIFDTESSFLYSLVIGMHKFLNIDKKCDDIIQDAIHDESWFSKHKWLATQKLAFRDLLSKVYQNVYSYKQNSARDAADWFLFQYGFSMDPKECDKYLQMTQA